MEGGRSLEKGEQRCPASGGEGRPLILPSSSLTPQLLRTRIAQGHSLLMAPFPDVILTWLEWVWGYLTDVSRVSLRIKFWRPGIKLFSQTFIASK